MQIKDVLFKDLMIMNLQAETKQEAIEEMVQRLYEKGIIDNVERYKAGIMARENQTSTGLGDGVAIAACERSVGERSGRSVCEKRKRGRF